MEQDSGLVKIKKRIGVILAAELPNETIYVDRHVPLNISEGSIHNVRFESFQKSNQNQYGSDIEADFTIDVWCSSKNSDAKRGDTNSAAKRDVKISKVDRILSSNKYITLLFDAGLIMSSTIDNVQTFESGNEKDANYVTMARANLNVRYYEDYKVFSGVLFNQGFTNVNLSLTDKGYKFKTE
mgnify:CR=1 FL=1